MSKGNVQKGRELENAVALIQRSILESDPEVKGTKFSIETNRVVIIAGVRHEIDVLVTTLPGSRYESTWTFECKNWEKPVGKNDVIILAEKVGVIGAARGFLVARSFSKDAVAQAKLDTRLKLIECTDEFTTPVFSIELQHSVTDLLPIQVRIKERGIAPKAQPLTLEWKGKICRFGGNRVDFLSFVDERMRAMLSADQSEKSSQYNHEGVHWGARTELFLFDSGEVLIGDSDVESMVLDIKFTVTIKKPKLLSKFELKSQGRAYSFETIESKNEGLKVQVAVVHRI